MQDKTEDEGNTVCIDKDDNEILREFNRRQYVTFRCYKPLVIYKSNRMKKCAYLKHKKQDNI